MAVLNIKSPELVTANWLQAQITQAGVSTNDIVTATGVNRASISAWVNGLRNMSKPVKAMFFFYFKSL
jgi:plasmid maintenance system antidote protein VapI